MFVARPRISRLAINPRVVLVEHLAIASAKQVGFAVRSIVVISRVRVVAVDVSSRYTRAAIWLLQSCRRDVVVLDARAGSRVLNHSADGSKVRLAAKLPQVGWNTTARRLVVAAIVA